MTVRHHTHADAIEAATRVLVARLAAQAERIAALEATLERLNVYPRKHVCGECALYDDERARLEGYNEALCDVATLTAHALAGKAGQA
jgi:hypothetical protein